MQTLLIFSVFCLFTSFFKMWIFSTTKIDLNRIPVPVKANITLPQTTYTEGQNISIPCNVEGFPIPQVMWYKDGRPLYQSRMIRISESNRLTIIKSNVTNSGEYECQAANQFSSARSSITIKVEGTYINPNCTDNPFFADCSLIVKANFCTHKYYARFCCRSCTEAGLLRPSYLSEDKQSALSSNLVRRK